MDGCTVFFNQIQDLRSRRLDDSDRQELFAHLAACDACRGLFDFHGDLTASGSQLEEPSLEELAAVRDRVLRQIRAEEGATFLQHRSIGLRRVGRRLLPAAAAILLALLAGLVGGRFIGHAREGEISRLVATLDSSARHNQQLHEVENSPWLLSNVNLRSVDADRVVLSFDVLQHLEVSRPKDDPLVQEVLVHALLDQSSLGSRLRAVSLAAETSADKVQEALVFAMLNDPDLPVRLRALEVLAGGTVDPVVQEALVQVLRQDGSVQMRLLALDTVAGDDPGRTRLLDSLEDGWAEHDPVIANRLTRMTNS